MKLRNLLDGVKLKTRRRIPALEIDRVTVDSKKTGKKSLFIAIKGALRDGHDFVREAIKNDSAIVLVEKKSFSKKEAIFLVDDTKLALSVVAGNFYLNPSRKLNLIGITGTNGKTTVSFLIESVFKSAKKPCGVIGTINYKTGSRLIPAGRTTPGALLLNSLLNDMVRCGAKNAVMEVSSHALEQKRVESLVFKAAIFTNLSHEHLDYHKTIEQYFLSKSKLFTLLAKNGSAIINTDDKMGQKLKGRIPGRLISYGINRRADVEAREMKLRLGGSRFGVFIKGRKTLEIKTPLIGIHNVYNILAAIASCSAQGINYRHIKKGIESVRKVPGRLENVKCSRGFRIFVDYAHTENALENVLSFLSKMKKCNIITVFGAGGERDRAKRPLMGRVVQRFSDFFIITNDNPRGENPREIAREIEKGVIKGRNDYKVILNRRSAIKNALIKARKDDIVLLAGKGHEACQVIGSKSIPFDDRKIAREILKNIKYQKSNIKNVR